MTRNIALLGTGLMGAPMARNIARAGWTLTAWNRSADKAAPLAADGITVATEAAQAVTGADIVISMIADGAVLTDLTSNPDLQNALKQGAIWVDMSSTKPDEARTAAERLAQIGVGFLDAPVSGGVTGAQEATLAIMTGGDAATFDAAKDVLGAMGRPTLVGPNGAGQLAKLANQAIVAVSIAAVAEATLLLEQGGADASAVRAALKGGFADSTILQQHGARMSRRDFTPGGPSRLQLKDLDNVLAEAGATTLPVVQHVRDRYARYVADLDGGARDHAGLFEELLDQNGIPSLPEKTT